ncbi:hypothetical protein NKR19_g8451 [Coniochaeta hoffmannii]|uniref:Uncharacterized protein n=1 Tax=Coniochaeta hoffmannii TaxID=91930 RepID=A0AA38VEN4_9PEZI|nr:hypothetical protein NKR19_g8451 [Coniochaeta hoffmannii]
MEDPQDDQVDVANNSIMLLTEAAANLTIEAVVKAVVVSHMDKAKRIKGQHETIMWQHARIREQGETIIKQSETIIEQAEEIKDHADRIETLEERLYDEEVTTKQEIDVLKSDLKLLWIREL